MVLEKLSQEMFNFYAPRFVVEIKEKKLAENISKAIINATINEKIDEGASFELTIHDEFDMNSQKFIWLDNELFNVGNQVTIKMGYGANLHTIFMGTIKALESSFFSGDTPTITIRGQDLSYDYIKRSAPERTFREKSYSDIARTIASEAGLNSEVEDTGKPEKHIRKNNNDTYYKFLTSLARKVGFTFYIDRKTMYFIKPKDDKREIFNMELGKDLISFNPTLKDTQSYTEVIVRGHNTRDPGTPLIGRATAGSERGQEPQKRTASQVANSRSGLKTLVITNVVVNSVEHANAIALSKLNSASDTFIEGNGECIGLPQIRPGITIYFDKMGKWFTGKYYVKAATHTINESGYRTRFTVKRNAI
jgi:phage protein D